jgi:hypothetical protein
MYTINLWNQFHLHRQKVALLFIFLLFLSHQSLGQEKKTYGTTRGVNNLPYYDDKIFHYGFSIGINSARYRVTQSSTFLSTDTILSVTPKGTGGFSLGFIVNYRIADHFDLRLLPTVAFYERRLDYVFAQRGAISQLSESTFIEFPLLLKYKSQRRKNLRMYMVAGVKPAIEAGSKKKDKKATELRTNNFDFSVDYGFGFDIYYPLFKFSPELRISHGFVSHGFVNMINNDKNPYAQSVNVLLTHTVTLYLHFE